MIYSIDLFMQLLNPTGAVIQLGWTALTPPQSRLFRDKLVPQIFGILCFPTHVKPVKKV
jgi:hypothetical protein